MLIKKSIKGNYTFRTYFKHNLIYLILTPLLFLILILNSMRRKWIHGCFVIILIQLTLLLIILLIKICHA